MSEKTVVIREYGLWDWFGDNEGCLEGVLCIGGIVCGLVAILGAIMWVCKFAIEYWVYVLCVLGGLVIFLIVWWVGRRTKFSNWRQMRPLLDTMDVTSWMDEKYVKVKIRPRDKMHEFSGIVIALHWDNYDNTYGGYIVSKKSVDAGDGLFLVEFPLNEIVNTVFKKVGSYDIRCKVFPVVLIAINGCANPEQTVADIVVDIKDAIRYAVVNHLFLPLDLWKTRSKLLNESLGLGSQNRKHV